VPTAGHAMHGGGHGGGHAGAPLAIWLGIFLDGIPESFVIGANVVHHSTVSLSLIVGDSWRRFSRKRWGDRRSG